MNARLGKMVRAPSPECDTQKNKGGGGEGWSYQRHLSSKQLLPYPHHDKFLLIPDHMTEGINAAWLLVCECRGYCKYHMWYIIQCFDLITNDL